MKTVTINTKSKNINKRSINLLKRSKVNGEILFKDQFDRAQEILSNSTFSKEVLDIINQQFSK
jgi:hypothetical protein